MSALIALFAAVIGPLLGQSAPVGLAVEVAEPTVEITHEFDGASVTVFGVAQRRGGDDVLAVIVTGPRQAHRIAEKQRIAGVWLPGRPQRIEGAPTYYSVATTAPLEAIPESARRALGVGASTQARSAGETADAFVRLKRRAGLYQDNPQAVRWGANGLFRTTVTLPATARVGEYQVRAVLIRPSGATATAGAPLRVRRVGLEQAIYDAAHNHGLLYGLFAVALAVFGGWAAAAAFNRRG